MEQSRASITMEGGRMDVWMDPQLYAWMEKWMDE